MLEFVKWARFDRMGAFAYSEEEGTYSAEHYSDEISPEEKERRLGKLMSVQQRISEELTAQKVGQCFRVIIDRTEGDYYVGRTQFDSPEVDPEVLILRSEGDLEIGTFYMVQVYESDAFDLYAHIV